MRLAITVDGQDELVDFDRMPDDATINEFAAQVRASRKAVAPPSRADVLTQKLQAIDDATKNHFPAPPGDYAAMKAELANIQQKGAKKATLAGVLGFNPYAIPAQPSPLKDMQDQQGNRTFPKAIQGPVKPAIFTTPQDVAAGSAARSKQPVTPDDFAGLNFSFDSFQRAMNSGGPVETASGGVMTLDKARRLLFNVTGKVATKGTMTASQVEQNQANDAYTAGGKAGFGQTVGFGDNKPMTVERSRALEEHRLIGPDPLGSKSIAAGVNHATDSLAGYLKDSGVSDAVASIALGPFARIPGAQDLASGAIGGLAAGTAMFAPNMLSEAITLTDPTRSSDDRVGAAANIGVALALPHVLEALKPTIASLGKLAMAGPKETAAFRSFMDAAHAQDEAGAAKAAVEMGVEPVQAQTVAKKVSAALGAFDEHGLPTPLETAPKTKGKSKVKVPAEDAPAIAPEAKTAPVVETKTAEPPAKSAAKPVAGNTVDTVPIQHANDFDANGNPIYNPDRAKPIAKPEPAIKPKAPSMADVLMKAEGEKYAGKPGDPNVTGVTLAQRSEEAVRLGTPEPEAVSGLTNKDAHAAGKQFVAEHGDGAVMDNLRKLSDESRAAKPDEIGAFVEVRRRLIRDLADANTAVDDAMGTPGHPAALEAKDAAMAKIREFDGHFDKVKGAGGQSLQALKIGTTLDRAQYADAATYKAAVTTEAERIKGEKLSTKQESALQKIIDQHEAKIKEIQAQHAKDLEAAAQTSHTKSLRTRTPRSIDDIRAARAQAVEVFRTHTVKAEESAAAARGEKLLSSGVKLLTEEQAKALVTIAKTFGEEGVLKVSEVAAKVVAHLKSEAGVTLTEDDVKRALSGEYEKASKGPKTKSQGETQVQAWRAELRDTKTAAAKAKLEIQRTEQGEIEKRIREALHSEKVAAEAETRANREAAARGEKEARNARREDVKAAVREDSEATRKAAREYLKTEGEARASAMRALRTRAGEEVKASRKARSENYEKLFGEQSRLEDSIGKLRERIASGDLSTKPKPERSPDLERMYHERDRLRQNIREQIEAMRPRSVGQRIGDAVSATQHFNIFSGTGIFAKLAGATAAHIPLEALTDALVSPARRLTAGGKLNLGDVAAKEVVSGAAQAEGVAKMLSRETLTDVLQKAKTGKNSLDVAAIERGQVASRQNHPIAGFFGNLHGAMKTPLQRFEYAKALRQRTIQLARQGADVTSASVQAEIVAGSYNDSLEAILKNDNALAKAISDSFKSLDKRAPGVGQLASTFVPVTRVGANYIGKGIQYTGAGVVEGALKHAFALGRGGVTPAEADAILKAYKRGGAGVGIAALVLGTDIVKGPGYYAPGTKKGEDEHYGDLEIAGIHVPHTLAHNPAFEAMQFWLTVKNGMAASKGDPGTAAYRAAFGLAQQTPGLDVAVDTGRAFAEGPAGVGRALGNHVKGIAIPQLVQAAARGTIPGQGLLPKDLQGDVDSKGNTVKRKTKGFYDVLKEGTPGLRKTLERKR